jgi:hypothetical protein
VGEGRVADQPRISKGLVDHPMRIVRVVVHSFESDWTIPTIPFSIL